MSSETGRRRAILALGRLGWETGVVHVGVELRRSGSVRYVGYDCIVGYERPEEVILFNAGYACYLIRSERPEKGLFSDLVVVPCYSMYIDKAWNA